MGELFRRPADLRDGRKRLFWWCDNVIFDDGHAAHMGMAGFMVYCALARYADGHNRAMLTQKALIAATGMSRRGVQSALNSLLQSGYLGVEKKALAKGEENIYVLRDLADIVPPRLAHDVRRLEEEPAHLVRLTGAPGAPDQRTTCAGSYMNKDEREEEKRETPARNAALVRLKSHWLATWGAQYGVPATWDPKDEPLLEQFLAKCGDDVDRAVGVMARYVADDTDTFWRGHPFRVLATQAHRWIPKSPRARLAAVTAAAKANPVDALSPEELAMAKADFLLAYPKASPGTRSRLDGSPRSVPEFVEFVFKLQTPLEEARP